MEIENLNNKIQDLENSSYDNEDKIYEIEEELDSINGKLNNINLCKKFYQNMYKNKLTGYLLCPIEQDIEYSELLVYSIEPSLDYNKFNIIVESWTPNIFEDNIRKKNIIKSDTNDEKDLSNIINTLKSFLTVEKRKSKLKNI